MNGLADPIDDLYQRIILDRARAPRHARRLACWDAEVEGDNPMCGDRLTLRIRRAADGAVEEVGYEARGCAISLASADLMADAVCGLQPSDIVSVAARFHAMLSTGAVPDDPTFGDLRALSGVHEFRSRIRCATLPWSALASALEHNGGKHGG